MGNVQPKRLRCVPWLTRSFRAVITKELVLEKVLDHSKITAKRFGS
jgi:hypothetical protein